MNKGPMDGARDGSASNRRSHVSWGNRLIRATDQLAIVAIEALHKPFLTLVQLPNK